jgi:molybdopterin-containing oxidoreductase family iron-sulfur binding subunit
MRLKEPKIEGKNSTWSAVKLKLVFLMLLQKVVKLFFDKYVSPSTEKLIAEFIGKNQNAKHVVYDLNQRSFRCFKRFMVKALVDYDFSKASLIVSVGADFLGDWQGGGFDAGYAKGRILKQEDVSSFSIRSKHDFVWCSC